jgi:hypothetical protein
VSGREWIWASCCLREQRAADIYEGASQGGELAGATRQGDVVNY